MDRDMKQLARIVLILSLFSMCFWPSGLQAQESRESDPDGKLQLVLYYVERKQVCQDGTDYDRCHSVEMVKELPVYLEELSSASFTLPSATLSFSGQQNEQFGERISLYNDRVNNGDVKYDKKRSIALVIRGEQGKKYGASITRYSRSNPSCNYSSRDVFGEGIWFNHQAAEYFHPSRRCKWTLYYNRKKYDFQFMP